MSKIIDADEKRFQEVKAERKALLVARDAAQGKIGEAIADGRQDAQAAADWDAADTRIKHLDTALHALELRRVAKAKAALSAEEAAIRKTNRAAVLKVLTAAQNMETAFKAVGEAAAVLMDAVYHANAVIRNDHLKTNISFAVRKFKFFLLSHVSKMPDCRMPYIGDPRTFAEYFPQPDDLTEKESRT